MCQSECILTEDYSGEFGFQVAHKRPRAPHQNHDNLNPQGGSELISVASSGPLFQLSTRDASPLEVDIRKSHSAVMET